MKVNEMDKYELTESIKRAKKILNDPQTDFHICCCNGDDTLKILDEINNPVTDKDGFVHKYYLSDGAKSIIEFLLKKR